jgi:hypothetical protein
VNPLGDSSPTPRRRGSRKTLRQLRAEWKRRTEALDKEIADADKRIEDSKEWQRQLESSDPRARIRNLLLRHSIQKPFGVPSDFLAECDKAVEARDAKFFEKVTKGLTDISAHDRISLIVRTIITVFRDLRNERHAQFLKESAKEYRELLANLKDRSPRTYRKLKQICKHSNLDIETILNPDAEIPPEFEQQLTFLNLPHWPTQKLPLPTIKEIREETIRRIRRQNPRFPIPALKYWSRYFKQAGLPLLPRAKPGPRKNTP